MARTLLRGARRRSIPYIERLADYWGDLCGSIEVASEWADRLSGVTRQALSRDKDVRGHFHSTSTCLSAFFAAGRYDELIKLVRATSDTASSRSSTARVPAASVIGRELGRP